MQERPNRDYDLAVQVNVPENVAEVAGAILMDFLGPFQWEQAGRQVVLTFYPPNAEEIAASWVLALLPAEIFAGEQVKVTVVPVSREWEQSWRKHFSPTVVGKVLIKPPWEMCAKQGETGEGPAANAGEPSQRLQFQSPLVQPWLAQPWLGQPSSAQPSPAQPWLGQPELSQSSPAQSELPQSCAEDLVEVVINPGLGFGTGQHPTTRGTLTLLQGPLAETESDQVPQRVYGKRSRWPAKGPLVDVGTGSGILAIAAAKLGWRPVVAFDNDPQALLSARENVATNGVEDLITVWEADLETAPIEWFARATVLANVALGPVMLLCKRLGTELPKLDKPARLIVSGLLAGEQEEAVIDAAWSSGFLCARRLYEAEWVSMELIPIDSKRLELVSSG